MAVDAPETVTLRTYFSALVQWWREGTEFLSSPGEIASHPAYQLIIGLGEAAVPLILEELRDRGGDWYIALRRITGASPVPEGAARSSEAVRQHWLDWGSGVYGTLGS